MNISEPAKAKKTRRIGIKWKMFMIIFAFVLFFWLIVWLFQMQILHYFYQRAKFDEFESVTKDLKYVLGNEISTVEVSDKCATDYSSDIWIYRIDGKNFDNGTKIVYSSGTREPLEYLLEYNFPGLYQKALNNNGKYVAMVPMDNVKDSYFELKIIKDNEGSPDTYPYVTDNVKRLHAICVNTVSKDGQDYAIIQCAGITPIRVMVQAHENQVLLIGTLLLVLSLLLATLMSGLITKPIEKVNAAAKSLALGKYDVDFSGGGYREIDELSDTLTYAAHELSKNDRLQKEIISNVSHDLRTPLTLIKGYSEVMRDIPGESTPENIQVIIDETTRLTELVNDMLDLSKLQAGSRSADMTEFCLTETVRETMFRYEKLTKQDGYKIEFSADKDVYVIADRDMILQVIYNLVNNAINYTGDDKKISVLQTVNGDTVRISVTDTGEGISEEDIPLIWDRYYKVDKVHRRAAVGTGLGLSIVKGILELHNATYGVSSIRGKGSTFWFELKTSDSAEFKAEVVDV